MRHLRADHGASALPAQLEVVVGLERSGGHTNEIASSDIFWFGRMSRPGTPIVVDNCNVFGRSARGSFGGTPTVNAAYIAAIGKGGNVSHVKQVSTGPCHDTSRGHLCRELCVGEYIRAGRE